MLRFLDQIKTETKSINEVYNGMETALLKCVICKHITAVPTEFHCIHLPILDEREDLRDCLLRHYNWTETFERDCCNVTGRFSELWLYSILANILKRV